MDEEKKTEDLAPRPEEKDEGGLAMSLYDWLQVMTGCLTVLILTLLFVGRILFVEGPSMLPTLHNGDIMLVREIGYIPRQGDVVVLTKPFRGINGPIVKRVVATAGQTVEIDYDAGTVRVDGQVLDEPYINYEPMHAPVDYDGQTYVVVPQGEIFVMGDNRNHSNDSRDPLLSTVDVRRVIGKVFLIAFPLENLGTIK